MATTSTMTLSGRIRIKGSWGSYVYPKSYYKDSTATGVMDFSYDASNTTLYGWQNSTGSAITITSITVSGNCSSSKLNDNGYTYSWGFIVSSSSSLTKGGYMYLSSSAVSIASYSYPSAGTYNISLSVPAGYYVYPYSCVHLTSLSNSTTNGATYGYSGSVSVYGTYSTGGGGGTTATATVSSATASSSSSGSISYSFSNCVTGSSGQPLCYYYSTSSATPSGTGSSSPASTQTINTWCKMANNSSSSGSQSLTGLSASTTYYVWVSATCASGATAQTPITIWSENNTLSNRGSFTTSSGGGSGGTTATTTISSMSITTSTCTLTVSGTNLSSTSTWYYIISSDYSTVANANSLSSSATISGSTLTITGSYTAGTTYYAKVSHQIASGATAQNPESSTSYTMSNVKSATVAGGGSTATLNAPTFVTPTNGAVITSTSFTYTIKHPYMSDGSGCYTYVAFGILEQTPGYSGWILQGYNNWAYYGYSNANETITATGLTNGHSYLLRCWAKRNQGDTGEILEPHNDIYITCSTSVTATASISSATNSGSSGGSFTYSFTNCETSNSSRPLVYYYSTSSTTPSGQTGNPSNTQTINTWCRLTNQSSLSGTQTLSGLSANTTYYVWVAGAVYPTTATPQTSITIWSETCTLSGRKNFTTSAPSYTNITINSISHVNNNNGTAVLTISATAGTNNPILSYQAGYSTSNTTVPTLSSAQSSNTITLTTGTGTFYYYVRVNGTYNSPTGWYGPYSVTTATSCTAPTSVSFTIQTANTRTAKITWSGGSGGNYNNFETYHWVWSTSTTNPPSQISSQMGDKTSSPQTGISLPAISSDTNFYAFVQTRGDAGTPYYSSYTRSSALSVTLCTAPTTVTATAGVNQATVNWSGASGGTNNAIQSYDVGYSTSSSATSPTSSTITSVTGTSKTFTGLTAGTTYYFFVRSVGVFSTSGWKKASAGVAPINYTACGAPTSVTVSQSGGTVTVSWSGASSGTNNAITGYGVGYSSSSGGTISGLTTVTTSATSGSTTFTGLTAGSTYYFAVRTQGAAGSSYYSGYTWSSAITISTHPTVTTGSVITKAQMDSLRSYKGNSPTAVTQYAVIYATVASTYSSATAGDSATASWYNNA